MTIRPATPADALYFSLHLRDSDRSEVEAAHGPGNVLAALTESIRGSFDCRVASVGYGPMPDYALFGCAAHRDHPEVGVPWLIGTSMVDRQRRFLTQYIPALVDEWRAMFPALCNFVHTDNTKSIRWLQWLGFTIAPAQPYGPSGEPFHPFYWVRTPCAP